MQMKTGSFGRILTVCVMAGVVVAGAAAFLWPQQYKSTATLRLDHPDPDVLNRVVAAALPRNALVSIINDYDLYPRERRRMPMEDVIDKVMRQETWVTPVAPNLAQVTFFYEDPIQAQRVSQDMVGRIIAANLYLRTDAISPSASDRTKGERIELVAAADQGKRTITGKERLAFAGLGLPLGLLFGVVLARILRRRATTAKQA